MAPAKTPPEKTPATKPPASYEAAMDELRDILGQLEQEDTNVDQLSELVDRAAVLLRFCRERLDDAEMNVSQAIDSLADLNEAAPSQDDADGDS